MLQQFLLRPVPPERLPDGAAAAATAPGHGVDGDDGSSSGDSTDPSPSQEEVPVDGAEAVDNTPAPSPPAPPAIPTQVAAAAAAAPAAGPAPATLLTEADADQCRQPTAADRMLDEVFNDHVHANPGTHLSGGIPAAEDAKWQRWWVALTGHPQILYQLPRGNEGKDLVHQFVAELRGVRLRQWNAERPLVFLMVMLVKTKGVVRFRDVRRRIRSRLALWRERGEFDGLVQDTLHECAARINGDPPRPPDDAQLARQFDATVRSGRLREAVRRLTLRAGGGVLAPEDNCTKTHRPVHEVLQGKHPAARDPAPEALEAYPALPVRPDLDISPDIIEQAGRRLRGGAGPSGLDAAELKEWLFRFGPSSLALGEELAQWTRWLANESPPWAAYRALMANRLIAIDKQPGVRPVGCGEVIRRLMAKAVILACGERATEACGAVNLCAGLSAGIEGAFHALKEAFPIDAVAPPPPAPTPTPPATLPPAVAAAAAAAPPPPPPPPTAAAANATVLVDARNGFNELNRTAMLWTVRHRWPDGARFAFNCYRHQGQLVMRQRDGTSIILLSQEGVTQGDPLSMILYGIGLLPLAEELRREFPAVVQPWYADDAAAQGNAAQLAAWLRRLQAEGPKRGYFPEAAKSILLVHPGSDAAAVRSALADFSLIEKPGARYLGGFLGSRAAMEPWLQQQVDAWVTGIGKLATAAKRYPHTAFSGLAHSLQGEWQYLQRMCAGVGPRFAPVEEAIASTFFPQLTGGDADELTEHHQRLRSIGAKAGGVGIRNPVHTADRCNATSVACTRVLVDALLKRGEWSLDRHMKCARNGRLRGVRVRKEREGEAFQAVRAAASAVDKRRLDRAPHTGRWLNVIPNERNDTALSAEEFRDSLRLRLGLQPLGLPSRCDACDAPFTVGHALQCKKGNLVSLRHDDVKAVWEELMGEALAPSHVRDEPYLIGRNRDRDRPPPEGPDPPLLPGEVRPPDLRGDIACHSFWSRGKECIFDVSVCDTDCKSYLGKDPERVLYGREKIKRQRYGGVCHEQRRHFTPLVYSVDGMVAEEAKRAAKRLGRLLSEKWRRVHSACCGYVSARLSIALVRTTSLCLRNSRVYKTRPRRVDFGRGLDAQLL